MDRNDCWKYRIPRNYHCWYNRFSILTPISYRRVISVHSNADGEKIYTKINNMTEKVRISSPAEEFNIVFNYNPQNAYTDPKGVRHDEPNFSYIPSAKTLIGPIAHIIILLPFGIHLYARSVNERNGNFILYPRLQKAVILCSILIIGIVGGLTLSSTHSLVSFYIGFLVTSFITYFLLPKILKWKVSWNFK